MKNNIGRLFEIILYNEDGPLYFDYLIKLENFCIDNNYSYYYITHNKDGGKIHTHYLIYTNGSTTTLDHISKDNDIPLNKIEKKNYLKSSIEYLVHDSTNSKNKAQYDWHNIMTNDIVRVEKIFNNLDENTTMSDLIRYIDSCKNIITYRDFVDYVLSHELWSYYRRSASILKLLIDEHNNKIKESW